MVRLSSSFWRFCVLFLPLGSTLSVPQMPLVEEPESEVNTLTENLALSDAELNITGYTSLDEWNPTKWDYDVIIVGGGLAASMSLARVAHTSLLYDSQEYRNGKTRYMHDVLGQDGKCVILCHEGLRTECT